tara:strand:+ start:8604 stop:9269 length:666 start_codon:yes stop_codon:yes gene_type:complete
MSKSETGIIVVSDGTIPIEIVKPAFDWLDSLLHNLPFLVTIVVVVCAAAVTYRSNRRSVESQNTLAQQNRQDEHQNKISEFRHQWLQEVRETAADICQVTHDLQSFIVQRNIARENYRNAGQKGDASSVELFSEEMSKCAETLKQLRSRYYRLFSKLQLLFKKEEPLTVDLFELLNSIKDRIYDFDAMTLDDEQIHKVIESLQVVLKSEWEATKAREWGNT